jgi:hypothetical protein
LDESLTYPTLQELKEDFHKISPLVYQKLLEATDEELDKAFPMGMNIDFFPETVLNFVGMCIGREDYLVDKWVNAKNSGIRRHEIRF